MKSKDILVNYDYACRPNYFVPRERWDRVRVLSKFAPGGMVGKEPYHKVLEVDDVNGISRTYLDGTPREYYVLPRDLVCHWEDQRQWFAKNR